MLISRNDGKYQYGKDVFAPLESIRVTIENIIIKKSKIAKKGIEDE